MLACLVVASLALAARADAFVYWANPLTHTIGRANLNGTDANQNFIGGVVPEGVAVDENHIYWADPGTLVQPLLDGQIGRANLDGTGVEPFFIDPGCCFSFGAVAVDNYGHVYWTSTDEKSGLQEGQIGRANIDGTDVNMSFITGAHFGDIPPAGGLAVSDGHIYWANSTGTIGRANIDGTGVDQNFITGVSNPGGVAIDLRHIYWANGDFGIGRANINGTDVNQHFVSASGIGSRSGVAVDNTHIYWSVGNSIGRAPINGSRANEKFISTNDGTAGIAVDLPLSAPPPATLTDLIDKVNGLKLQHGIDRSLHAKLQAAQRSLAARHLAAACGQLEAFAHEVKAQRGKKIAGADAASLLSEAKAVRKSLGCGKA